MYLALFAISRSLLPLSFALSLDRGRSQIACCCTPTKSTGLSAPTDRPRSSVVTSRPRISIKLSKALNAPRSLRFSRYSHRAICRLPTMAVSIINTCSTTVIHKSIALSLEIHSRSLWRLLKFRSMEIITFNLKSKSDLCQLIDSRISVFL